MNKNTVPWLWHFSHSLQQYTINFQRFENRIWQSLLREFRNFLFESISTKFYETVKKFSGSYYTVSLRWMLLQSSKIWVKLETCQSWWKKLKVNQHCLSSLKTITEELNFVFFCEPCWIFHKMSSNDLFS